MKKSVWRFMMSALILVLVACGGKNSREDSQDMAEDQNDEKFDNKAEKDADFAVEAASGGMMEVQLGTLASSKASSAEVKKFARMMVEDHTKANNELQNLARQKNITLPSSMSNEAQRKYDNLKDKTGDDFDKDYMDLMVKDHKEDVRKFEEEAEDGNDPAIKSWASSTVTTLRHHLDEAQRVQDIVKNNKRR